jgi:hypothetical protein
VGEVLPRTVESATCGMSERRAALAGSPPLVMMGAARTRAATFSAACAGRHVRTAEARADPITHRFRRRERCECAASPWRLADELT